MSTTKPTSSQRGRPGRPRTGERAARREAVLEAAFEELIETGYDRLTMSSVAARVSASKETLYRWFGSRDGLFATMIEANADESAERVASALDRSGDPVEVLTGYASGLFTLLTGPQSVALNRAAMSSSQLAGILLESGRHRIGPIVEDYLGRLAADGYLDVDDPGEAFQLLYGLTVQDTQIRVLLGEPPPSASEIRRRAQSAVSRFLALTRPDAVRT